MLVQPEESRQVQRRRSKWIGFIIAEAVAIAVLFLVGTFAVSLRAADPTLTTWVNVATIVAGSAVALIPIAFFGITPLFPRADH